MFRIALATVILIAALLAPAAAMKAVANGHGPMAGTPTECACCDEAPVNAALACAVYCYTALPSALDALPEISLAQHPILVLITDGDGMTVEPPVPPPRA